jgi:hypothetical protein
LFGHYPTLDLLVLIRQPISESIFTQVTRVATLAAIDAYTPSILEVPVTAQKVLLGVYLVGTTGMVLLHLLTPTELTAKWIGV